jgi:hypothetical protein
MIHRPNRYAEPCYFCKEVVQEMQGWLRNKTTKTPHDGNFITVCKECFVKNRAVLHPKHGIVLPVGEWKLEDSPRPSNRFYGDRRC